MISTPVTRQELKAVAVLSAGFGLVGIDRFLISTMFPTIAKELHLGYGDIGTITGALAIAWGLAALVMGNVSDRIGQRRVLVGSLIVFSLLIGLSGLAASLFGLVMVRIVMGFADGAFTPASIAATINVSPPERRGRNVGFQQNMLNLFGLALAPLLVSYLLSHGVDWRYIFSIFVIPGLLVAWATWRIILQSEAAPTSEGSLADWGNVLKYRNIKLLMVGMFCWLTCLITSSAFLPNYLLDHLKLAPGAMGKVMSAIGFGALTGTIVLSMLSDRIGRKPVMAFGMALMLAAYFPGFHMLAQALNPALAEAQAQTPVIVIADPADCSVQFDPVGKASFTSACDIAKSTLANAGVSYRNEAGPVGSTALVRIGAQTIPSTTAKNLPAPVVKAVKASVEARIRTALTQSGYPAKADPKRMNLWAAFGVLSVFVVAASALYGPIAATLVELFPTRVRYTALSLPYHIGTGWVGGFVPFTAFAIVTAVGDIYSGLWYPFAFTAVALAVCLLFYPETRGRSLEG